MQYLTKPPSLRVIHRNFIFRLDNIESEAEIQNIFYIIRFDEIIMRCARHTLYHQLMPYGLYAVRYFVQKSKSEKSEKWREKESFPPFGRNLFFAAFCCLQILPLYFKFIIILYYFMELFCDESCGAVDSRLLTHTHTHTAHTLFFCIRQCEIYATNSRGWRGNVFSIQSAVHGEA